MPSPTDPGFQKRVTVSEAGRPKQLAPDGTPAGVFRVVALNTNTDKIGLGGEPDWSLADDRRLVDGPISAAATQNVPLYDPGYGRTIRGDLSKWWVDVRVANEGVCWVRIE